MDDEKQLYANANAPTMPVPAAVPEAPKESELAAINQDTTSTATLMPVSTESSERRASNGLIFLLGLGIAIVVVGVTAFIVYRKIQASRYEQSLDDLPPVSEGRLSSP